MNDATEEEFAAYRAWMFSGPDGGPGEPWEIQERAWLGGFRAGRLSQDVQS